MPVAWPRRTRRVSLGAAAVGALCVLLGACGQSSTGSGSATTATTSPGAGTGSAGTASPSALVDPFMGTGVGGASVGEIDTFPGADVPFGMVQWSPDTTPDRPSGGGYAYADSQISGFSLTHMSGPGCPVYGDVPILPTTAAVGSDPDLTSSSFSHATEVAHPGSYAVTAGGVRVELAVTPRTGLGRFTFPGSGAHHVLFKVDDSADGSASSAIAVVGDREVDGSVVSGGFCQTSGNYHLYFAARFDTPFSGFGTWDSSAVHPGARTSTKAQTGGYVTFGSATAWWRCRWACPS